MKKIFALILIIFAISCVAKKANEIKIFPVYGNYCGHGNPNMLQKADPINVTDFLCEERLDCYKRNGAARYKDCDRLMVIEMKKAKAATSEEKAVQQAIINYFSQ